ncbi:MAG TPA: alpha/beta fold hydrolase [Bryobacteraceae bacterium]|jgi:pimeloyl-ACP methyl ester carboxylesterase|nr:alpha/beta fold hydrolase [Bryobacteraceae bacterium]
MPYTISNGARIYWEESGAGEPLLLIMGLGYSHEMWFRTRPVVSARYRTIVFDNRGVGKSDVPQGAYPIAQMAADAAAVMDAAGVQRAHVLGISMGGMIAQEFAINYPERVNRLVLGCTACGGPKSIPAAQKVLDILMARATMTPDEGTVAMVPHIYDATTPREKIDEDLIIRRRTYPEVAGYVGQVQGIMAWSSFDRLSQIKAPTLVIHGETDELVPPGNAGILAGNIAGSRLVMLPHASHIFPTDQTETSHREILSFLSGE